MSLCDKLRWCIVWLFVILLLYGVYSFFIKTDVQTNDFIKLMSDKACGKRLVQRVGLVQGGYSTHPGDWPWHVALYRRDIIKWGFEYACGGSIVHRYLVITAAHCVTFAASRRKIPTENLLLKLGRFNLSNDAEEHAEEFNVIESIVHVGFRPTTFENDIAILRVEVPIIFNDYIQPVCLWKRDDGFESPNMYNQPGTVVGWGLTDENKVATLLNEARMPMVDTMACLASDRAFFETLLNNKSYCAGYKNGTGVCNGDSGGGMFFQIQNRWYLKGVVSFSNTIDSSGLCNLKQYIGFTDAAQYIDWLYENTPNSGIDDPILGHPNIGLINQENCGRNVYVYEFDEERKPIINQYPWMVTIRHPTVNSRFVSCNGVLLNRNYVLASYCDAFRYDPLEALVTLGEYDTSTPYDCAIVNGTTECFNAVQTVLVEELFRKDDLVLARLSTPALIAKLEHVESICLPVTPQQRAHLFNHYILTGWKQDGLDEHVLQRALLETIELKQCQAAYQDDIFSDENLTEMDDRTICIRNPENPFSQPHCTEYMTGAAIQTIDKESNRYLLYGISSIPGFCEYPQRFIAVSKYLEWILDTIRH